MSCTAPLKLYNSKTRGDRKNRISDLDSTMKMTQSLKTIFLYVIKSNFTYFSFNIVLRHQQNLTKQKTGYFILKNSIEQNSTLLFKNKNYNIWNIKIICDYKKTLSHFLLNNSALPLFKTIQTKSQTKGIYVHNCTFWLCYSMSLLFGAKTPQHTAIRRSGAHVNC